MRSSGSRADSRRRGPGREVRRERRADAVLGQSPLVEQVADDRAEPVQGRGILGAVGREDVLRPGDPVRRLERAQSRDQRARELGARDPGSSESRTGRSRGSVGWSACTGPPIGRSLEAYSKIFRVVVSTSGLMSEAMLHGRDQVARGSRDDFPSQWTTPPVRISSSCVCTRGRERPVDRPGVREAPLTPPAARPARAAAPSAPCRAAARDRRGRCRRSGGGAPRPPSGCGRAG